MAWMALSLVVSADIHPYDDVLLSVVTDYRKSLQI